MQFVISKYGENSFSKSYKVNVDLIISEISKRELYRNLKNIHPPCWMPIQLADDNVLPV
jgi:hypothetical protein